MPKLLRLVSILTVAAFTGPCEADQFRPPRVVQGPPVSIQAYGTQNPACRAWTDGCVLCRTGEDGHSRCSLPGIACQPAGITCKMMR